MVEFNGRRLYTGVRLDYRLRLCALTSASRAISAVAELLVYSCDERSFTSVRQMIMSAGLIKACLINPFNASCSELLLFKGFSAILV